MKFFKTLSLVIAVIIFSIDYSCAEGVETRNRKKKVETKEVSAKQAIKERTHQLIPGSHVMVRVKGGEKVKAVIVCKTGKKKYFVRAWGESNRVGTCAQRRMSFMQ